MESRFSLSRTPVWLDGKIVAGADAQVSVFSHALHYGTAVFDGCRFYRTADGSRAIFRLRDHLRRFLLGARLLYMDPPWSLDELYEGCLEVVRACDADDGYLRQIFFYGDGPMGVGASTPVRTALMTWRKSVAPMPVLKVRVASFGHGQGWIPATKLAGGYARSFLARREAERTGCDESLFLGQDGTVAEAAAATVFAVRDGRLVTPPLSEPLLPGITRTTLLDLARDRGIVAEEQPIRRDQLLAADEVFLASSGGEVQAVGEFEGIRYAAPGTITKCLAEAYLRAVRGEDERHVAWSASRV
jgi:branched-chain amino acid aminotransferase